MKTQHPLRNNVCAIPQLSSGRIPLKTQEKLKKKKKSWRTSDALTKHLRLFQEGSGDCSGPASLANCCYYCQNNTHPLDKPVLGFTLDGALDLHLSNCSK